MTQVRLSSAPEERLVRAVLRHGSVDWPAPSGVVDQTDTSAPDPQAVLSACARHGVTFLVYSRLKPTAAWQTWPEDLRRALEQQTQTATTRDLIRARELAALLAALAGAGIEPLVMKGAALAHTHYPSPVLRARQDTDLLVPKAQAAKAADLLEARGYRTAQRLEALARFNHQITYGKRDGYGIKHVVDLHWRVSNTELFALAWTQAELEQRAVPLPAHGSAARVLSDSDALLLACAHRAHHAYEPADQGEGSLAGDRLIWLYDIHLLAQAMSSADWESFTQLAIDKRLQSICLDSLDLTRQALGTEFPGDVIESLTRTAARDAIPLDALKGSELQRLLATVRAVSGWPRRLALLADYAFPPRAYILAKYDSPHPSHLPWLYIRRIAEGLRGRHR